MSKEKDRCNLRVTVELSEETIKALRDFTKNIIELTDKLEEASKGGGAI